MTRPIPLTAGRPILALDAMPADYEGSDDNDLNVTSTTYIPRVSGDYVVFEAPTSGKVLLIVGGSLIPGSNGFRIHLGMQTKQDDVNGLEAGAPGISASSWTTPRAAIGVPLKGSQFDVLEGLEPGRTYIARAMISVSEAVGGGHTGDPDCIYHNLMAIPVS